MKKQLLNTCTFLLLTVAFETLFLHSLKAQPLCNRTDSLTINTGIDPQGNAITYSPSGVIDPFWTIHDQKGPAPAGVTLGNPAAITFNGAMASSPNSSLISYSASGGLTGYQTTGYPTTAEDMNRGAFTLTYRRTFRTCVDDTLSFYFDMAFDNYLEGIWINGNLIPSSSSPLTVSTLYYSFSNNIYTAQMFLPAGTHTIDIEIGNAYNVIINNPTSLNILAHIKGLTNSLVTNDSDPKCSCDCPGTCYWKMTGNHISGTNNIFGTLTNDDVRVQTNSLDRGIITNDGQFGWNTMTPSAWLHVDCDQGNNTPGLSDIRFENLEQNDTGTLLIIDHNGYVFNSHIPLSGIGGINNCQIPNMIPKTNTSSGDMVCSQIFDDNTSVGINTTGGFSYTWSGGLTGSTPPASSGTVRLDVNGVARGLAFMATSDRRYKTDIRTIESPNDIISGLSGKTYNWTEEVRQKTGAAAGRQYGFIAQEMMEILPEAVIIDEEGNYAINYNAVIPVLVESQKELLQKYTDMAAEMEELKRQIATLSSNTPQVINTLTTGRNVLHQNNPNPFNQETKIAYEIHQIRNNASITVYDLNGKRITQHSIQQAGKGSVTIIANTLPAGVYLYSLEIDGAEVATRKMILTQ